MPTVVTSLFGKAKTKMRETPRAVTPFGVLVSFIEFLGQVGYAQQVELVVLPTSAMLDCSKTTLAREGAYVCSNLPKRQRDGEPSAALLGPEWRRK